MRIAVATAVACLSIVSLTSIADAQASIKQFTNIPAQALDPALQMLAKERRFSVVYVSEEIASLNTAGAVGELTVDEALTRLLQGTGFTYRYVNDETVTIVPVSVAPVQQTQDVKEPAISRDTDARRVIGAASGGELASQTPSLFARANASEKTEDTTPSVASSSSKEEGDARLDEIVVTAQKREERLLDVPVPVGVIQAQELTQTNQVLLRDWFMEVPGLTVQPGNFSQQTLVIRGIASGGGDPTVAVTLDGIPLTGSTAPTVGTVIPDIDPNDLARIEVLRGPQGTLYGAESMGGLINYVTVDPTTSGFSGRMEAGTSSIQNGAEPGFNVRASANIPVNDTLAIGVSGYRRQDPGYIDNPILNQQGINEAQASGGRLAALWKPASNISLKVGALIQKIEANGYSDSVPGPSLTSLQQNYIPGVRGYQRTLEAYSAILKADLGAVQLTSNTGYSTQHDKDALDFSYGFGGLVQQTYGPTYGPNANGSIYSREDKGSKFTQEIRLNGSLGSKFDWLAGVFYTEEKNHDLQGGTAENSVTGAVIDPNFWISGFHASYENYAAFLNLTYKFTDRLDVQVGARGSHIHTTDTGYDTGTLYGGATVADSQSPANNNVFDYLVTPRFKVTSTWMVYARFASAFRPGYPNPNPTPLNVPLQSAPDSTKDYEIGTKASFLNNRLSLDTSIFYIDWANIQTDFYGKDNGFTYTANGSDAKSEGLEVSVEAHPTDHFQLTGWGTYTNAKLTSDFPANSAVYGLSGDRLPISPQWAGHISAQQDFELPNSALLFAKAEWSYVGDRLGIFQSAGTARPFYPAYNKVDLDVGLRLDDWTATLYVNNVANERGIVGYGTTPISVVYITPRTIGASLSKRF